MHNIAQAATDYEAYWRNPALRWIYMKPLLYDRLGVPYGLFPAEPVTYPVAVKPVVNLYGLALGAHLAYGRDDLAKAPGCLWMPVLIGEHVSADLVLIGGDVVDIEAVKGNPHRQVFGLFESWEIYEPGPLLYALYRGVCKSLDLGEGRINIETIGLTPIEVHLRHSDEYGPLHAGTYRYAKPVFTQNPVRETEISDQENIFSCTEADGSPEYAGRGWYRHAIAYS